MLPMGNSIGNFKETKKNLQVTGSPNGQIPIFLTKRQKFLENFYWCEICHVFHSEE